MSLSIPSQIQWTVGTYLSPKSTNWGLAEVMRNLLAVALDASHTSSLNKNKQLIEDFVSLFGHDTYAKCESITKDKLEDMDISLKISANQRG